MHSAKLHKARDIWHCTQCCCPMVQAKRQTWCYHLDKRLNCLIVGAILPGSAVCMIRVLYTSRVSAKDPVGGCWLSQSDLLGYPNLVSG
jgi:hypothetical protein